ncbi:hypothetical protein IPF86_01675 [Candidatus Nomurabacteria bacterium]|nr:MAG: hypothetical protein IPF86_01675 [Candidatus Nomurabacteria bacterium]
MKNSKKLLIVAGAAGEIGTEYCKMAIAHKVNCIGIVRNRRTGIKSPFFTEVVCGLDKEASIHESFADVDFSEYKEIIYLHTIGVDNFDPRGYPNIEPLKTIPLEIYDSNVNSFKYLLRYCGMKISALNDGRRDSKISLKIAIIAGVSDKYTPFVIEPFCEAKFILRQYIQSYIQLHPDWISGLSINITSTITASALRVRPHADTTYWLQPSEVVQKSFETLISNARKYKEMDIIKNFPDFIPGYYMSNKDLYEKWSRETGVK